MDDQELLSPEAENADALGASDQNEETAKDSEHSPHAEVKEDLPAFAKERLGRQEKRHQRELRELRTQMHQMQSQLSSNPKSDPQSADQNAPLGVDDQIQRAVQYALGLKDKQALDAKNAEKVAHVHEQYQSLQEQLDKGSDKYDDFDEVVRSPKAPFTDAMRDAALMLPHSNADEVLYKLGKNKDELKRISQLHPIDQARELMKLSVALKNGEDKGASAPRPIGQIKNNPVSSSGVTEKTSVREIREKMKAGWK